MKFFCNLCLFFLLFLRGSSLLHHGMLSKKRLTCFLSIFAYRISTIDSLDLVKIEHSSQTATNEGESCARLPVRMPFHVKRSICTAFLVSKHCIPGPTVCNKEILTAFRQGFQICFKASGGCIAVYISRQVQ